MKIKTSDLIDLALDWAVGIAAGYELNMYGVDPSIRARVPGLGVHAPWKPTKFWNQGGPIIEREKITASPMYEYWIALKADNSCERWEEFDEYPCSSGPTPLIAAMRCYVASKLGDEVDVPDSLL